MEVSMPEEIVLPEAFIALRKALHMADGLINQMTRVQMEIEKADKMSALDTRNVSSLYRLKTEVGEVRSKIYGMLDKGF